jgi:hypothetical protein
MAIKKTAGIVTPKVTSNITPQNEQKTLLNGIATPKVTYHGVVNDGLVTPKTVSDRIQPQAQNASGLHSKEQIKGIVTPAAVTKPTSQSTNNSSGEKK